MNDLTIQDPVDDGCAREDGCPDCSSCEEGMCDCVCATCGTDYSAEEEYEYGDSYDCGCCTCCGCMCQYDEEEDEEYQSAD